MIKDQGRTQFILLNILNGVKHITVTKRFAVKKKVNCTLTYECKTSASLSRSSK